MGIVSVRIPQIGEGLQEARLVAVLKQPGEAVKRDEPIYQMETDKAVMDVESPFEGILTEWLAQPDDILAIGAEVARMEVAQAPAAVQQPEAKEQAPRPEPAQAGNAAIPPRTRAYAKEKGITEEELASIKPMGSKLMPSDIDSLIASRAANDRYEENALTQKQRLLASRLVRGTQLVVPGTISVVANWYAIETHRTEAKSRGDEFQPSAFTMFAYAVAQALKEFPMFRSTLVGEDRLRTYRHAALGIAVALPGDELVLAVVEDADTLDWRTFAERTRERIELARSGQDQVSEAVTISLTNMQAHGIRDAVPVVVPPAVGTLFLGEAYYGFDGGRYVNLGLTFDHRLINGVGAALFLNAVKAGVENPEFASTEKPQ
jgi:pyruvate dehydrogenase E2 component (dihydrolipoamide acetyltransferase)